MPQTTKGGASNAWGVGIEPTPVADVEELDSQPIVVAEPLTLAESVAEQVKAVSGPFDD